MEKKDSASEEAVQGIQENGVEPQAVEPKPEPPCEPYRKPVKMVAVPSQMDGWQKSLAFADVVMFILGVNKAVRCKPRSSPRPQSEVVKAVVAFLEEIRGFIKEIPPVKQAMRFGNKAFHEWHNRVTKVCEGFHQRFLSADLIKSGVCLELCLYFLESFGNAQRIDYGTGHELCFVAWMACLQKLGVTQEDDLPAMGLDVFWSYLALMRDLQKIYWLEPAGSKGVWGLDDYQFLPFLWGASQLVGQFDVQTGEIADDRVIERHCKDFMYLDAVKFVKEVKTGPFGECSPMLWDISQVPTWSKTNQGLIKMYDGEVLAKFPIIQHFYFGSILPFSPAPPSHPYNTSRRKPGQRRPAPSFKPKASSSSGAMPAGVGTKAPWAKAGVAGGAAGGGGVGASVGAKAPWVKVDSDGAAAGLGAKPVVRLTAEREASQPENAGTS